MSSSSSIRQLDKVAAGLEREVPVLRPDVLESDDSAAVQVEVEDAVEQHELVPLRQMLVNLIVCGQDARYIDIVEVEQRRRHEALAVGL